ncbi:hypothetical protein PUNSTDRAFT_45248 [Punctularia strigosozonata HHB-11173 SS5]|uniref:uncharacterized protein n=1 Tax=Punctularia strigosozonata (strain HHB-11173) TaxID=741275 RepID=UPI0004416950|nr:uncharacterized protein PUNSTDRAFT_45248 [Punctularia strigosozonata HHB-11173 SS5]EIN07730.1 hypothetical protein PUNSTDRAFT_45248 [Punctularia strigosozonata HHB-11173 SS5]
MDTDFAVLSKYKPSQPLPSFSHWHLDKSRLCLWAPSIRVVSTRISSSVTSVVSYHDAEGSLTVNFRIVIEAWSLKNCHKSVIIPELSSKHDRLRIFTEDFLSKIFYRSVIIQDFLSKRDHSRFFIEGAYRFLFLKLLTISQRDHSSVIIQDFLSKRDHSRFFIEDFLSKRDHSRKLPRTILEEITPKIVRGRSKARLPERATRKDTTREQQERMLVQECNAKARVFETDGKVAQAMERAPGRESRGKEFSFERVTEKSWEKKLQGGCDLAFRSGKEKLQLKPLQVDVKTTQSAKIKDAG